MILFLFFCSLIMQTAVAERYIAERQYTITIDEDGNQPILLYFNQECINTLQADYHAPLPKDSIEVSSTISQWLSWQSWGLATKIGILGCVAAIIYAVKTKLNLYSLSKACFQAALWSLWQTKSSTPQIHEIDTDPDIDLLHAILKTYHTEKYAVAISHFLHDVDKEIEHLEAYLKEAQRAQESILQLILPDMRQEISEAESRLRKLTRLKQQVLSWLSHHHAHALQEPAW